MNNFLKIATHFFHFISVSFFNYFTISDFLFTHSFPPFTGSRVTIFLNTYSCSHIVSKWFLFIGYSHCLYDPISFSIMSNFLVKQSGSHFMYERYYAKMITFVVIAVNNITIITTNNNGPVIFFL